MAVNEKGSAGESKCIIKKRKPQMNAVSFHRND